MKQIVALGGLMIVIMLSAIAQGGEADPRSAALIEGAKKENKMVFYTSVETEFARLLTTAFEAVGNTDAAKVIASFALVAATGHLTAADLSLDVEIKNGEDYIAKVEDVWQELRALD